MESKKLTYIFTRTNPIYLIASPADRTDPEKVPPSAEAGTFVFHIASKTVFIKQTDGTFAEDELTPALFALMF